MAWAAGTDRWFSGHLDQVSRTALRLAPDDHRDPSCGFATPPSQIVPRFGSRRQEHDGPFSEDGPTTGVILVLDPAFQNVIEDLLLLMRVGLGLEPTRRLGLGETNERHPRALVRCRKQDTTLDVFEDHLARHDVQLTGRAFNTCHTIQPRCRTCAQP